jgi:hypothetical protein
MPCHTDPLYVVTSVFNPLRFKSRVRLYKEFAKRTLDAGAKLLTVEVAFGDRVYEVTEAGNPWHVQLRTNSELWLKENALNLGFQRLPHDWRYAAWVDADIQFARPDWVEETKHQLQHAPVVQMFSTAHDMSPKYDSFQTFHGFAYCYRNHIPPVKTLQAEGYYPHQGRFWHPGFAWAYTREAFDALGGLIDWGVLGAGDWHMAKSLVGEGADSAPGGIDPGYKESIAIWQARADRHVMGHIGYVPGAITHYWHGRKANRGYQSRWQILVRNKFDPELDLKRDWQGLWQLTDRTPQLKRDIQDYFAAREEDEVTMS